MERRNRHALVLTTSLLMIAMALSSCTVPLSTSSSADLATPTLEPAELSTPTEPPVIETPLAVDIPTLTAVPDCDRVEFVSDVTYPDETSVKANEVITKTWRVKNIGSCTWDAAYKLVYIRGEQMNGTSPAEVISSSVAPGGEVELSLKLNMPEINGIHWGVWQIYNAAGQPVLKADGKPQELSILINVTNGRGGRVTAVRIWAYTFTGVKCTNNVQYDVSVNIVADGPIGVGYAWNVTNGALTVVSQNYVFGSAGSLQVTTHIDPPFADPKNVQVTLTANGVSSSYTICP